jgi:hypothetical protein
MLLCSINLCLALQFLLGPSFPQLDPSFPQLGPSFPQLDPSFPQLDSSFPQLGPSFPQKTPLFSLDLATLLHPRIPRICKASF